MVHNLDAQRRLGEELITGSEVGRNPIEGRKILEVAVAAGDVRAQLTRQVTTAAGDATTAAIAVEKYLTALRTGSLDPEIVGTGGYAV